MVTLARRVCERRQCGPAIYSLHAPEVEYIRKGKAHRRYELGVKVSVATTLSHAKGGQFVTDASMLRLRGWPFRAPGDPRDAKRRVKKFIIITAWAVIGVLAWATLARVGLMYAIYLKLSPLVGHPSMRTFAAVEHVIAFALFGGLFSFAYPNRVIFVCGVVFITAVMLEYLQTLTPDRHGTILDACQKIAGGGLGILAARATLSWHPHDRVGPHSG